MPLSKIHPQCEAVVPIRMKVCKSCQHVLQAKITAEHNLPQKAMKYVCGVLLLCDIDTNVLRVCTLVLDAVFQYTCHSRDEV